MQQHLRRVSPTQLRLSAPSVFPVTVFANAQVPLEPCAIRELLSVLETQQTLETLPGHTGTLDAVSITPDFHKGAGIPIGTVLQSKDVLFPQAVGNDINCGMRLHTTNLDAAALAPRLAAWEPIARRLFFEGGRQIPMSGADRESLLLGGLAGLFANSPCNRHPGLWADVAHHGWDRQLDHVDRHGSLPAATASAFGDWIGAANQVSYDDQIGSIGGGNHFVEIQRVETILDRSTAYAWGLQKGTVTVMIHSGSVGIGAIAGRFIRELLQADYPSHCPHPRNGIYPLFPQSRAAGHFWNHLHNAANFAFANRLFLAAAAVASLQQIVGPMQAPLLYDSPHNLVWPLPGGLYRHRKGATSARDRESMQGTPFGCWGEPVLVPGSMGASSFILAGQGNPEALESASHGAGRALSRGDAMRSSHEEFERFLHAFRVVTPLDLNRPGLRGHAGIVNRKKEQLRAEGPHAFKGIHAIIDTLSDAGIARPVAELVPLATIKG